MTENLIHAREVLADDRRPTRSRGERANGLDRVVRDGDAAADLEHLAGALLLTQDDGNDARVERRLTGRGLRRRALTERGDDAAVTDRVIERSRPTRRRSGATARP